LVKLVAVVQTGGIYNPNQGVSDEVEVIAVGPDVEDVRVGDHCVVRKFCGCGTEIKHDGIEYLVVSQDELLLVLGD
jgi:co-chaperonin GroES (HSP10)